MRRSPFGSGDGIPELSRGVDPQLDSLVRVGERRFLSPAVGHATGQFRDFGRYEFRVVS
jgi:hypothetical protein